ncbi:hypothetical protein J3R83DRAFT_1542 [Lanmaoa asiatica]|nr:hypothetical protein J3R83DRAFT_1542 [Lanmaoa asiatica]
MPSSPINVGVVGLSTAGWARVLESALRTLGDTYRVVAVSTTNETSARASAQRISEETKYPVKAYYGDTAQIANDPDVEFVIVAVKAPEHRKALLPVIQAKKPFFIEWPVGRNLQETQELAETARLNGVRSMVGLQGRQSPVLNKAKELIASGKIGKMLSCSVIAATQQELLSWGPLVRRSVAYTTDISSGNTKRFGPMTK